MLQHKKNTKSNSWEKIAVDEYHSRTAVDGRMRIHSPSVRGFLVSEVVDGADHVVRGEIETLRSGGISTGRSRSHEWIGSNKSFDRKYKERRLIDGTKTGNQGFVLFSCYGLRLDRNERKNRKVDLYSLVCKVGDERGIQ